MSEPTPGFDGLRNLVDAKKRKPGPRTVERPLHPARESKVVIDLPAEEAAGAEPTPPPAVVAPRPREARTAPVATSLAPATVSLDRATEEVLEAVRSAGRFSTPRVDANRSATIRLAMARLAEQMTPEEIAAELARRAPKTTTAGRKRL